MSVGFTQGISSRTHVRVILQVITDGEQNPIMVRNEILRIGRSGDNFQLILRSDTTFDKSQLRL